MGNNQNKNEISRAERARSLMQDQMLQEALTAIKGEIYNKFLATSFNQSGERDELWRKSQTISAFENYLHNVMLTGQLAQQTLDED